MPPLIRIGHKRMLGFYQQNLSGLVVPTGSVQRTLLAPPVPVGELTPMLALYPHLNSAFAELTYAAEPTQNVAVEAGVTAGAASTYGVLQGRWLQLNSSASVINDPTAPAFGPTVYNRPWFAGNNSGQGPGQMTVRRAGTVPTNGYLELYQAMIVKLPDPGDGLIELTTSSCIAKMWGFWSTGSQNNPFHSLVRGVGTLVTAGTNGLNRRAERIRLDWTTQTGVADNDADKASDNYSGGSATNQTISVDNWYRIELYIKCNTVPGTVGAPTGPGNLDGEVRSWLTNLTANPNGTPVQISRHTDFKLRTQQKPRGLTQWLYDPTFGGANGDALTRTQNILHAYCFQAWGTPL